MPATLPVARVAPVYSSVSLTFDGGLFHGDRSTTAVDGPKGGFVASSTFLHTKTGTDRFDQALGREFLSVADENAAALGKLGSNVSKSFFDNYVKNAHGGEFALYTRTGGEQPVDQYYVGDLKGAPKAVKSLTDAAKDLHGHL